MKERVAILDAGAQYGKVIDRRCRELNVASDLLPFSTPASSLQDYGALILSGGPQSVYDQDAPAYDPAIFSLDIPVLGICYGMQLLNYVSGGTVHKKALREDGPCVLQIASPSPLFQNISLSQQVLMSHGDSIDRLAEGFRVIGTSDGLVAAIENRERNFYGVQFHPEVDLTEHGKTMLANFLYTIAGFTGTYTIGNRQEQAIASLRHTVGDKPVLALVSGGVDSTVCAALLRKALSPEQVYAVHIDNGFMRLHESEQVATALRNIGLELRVIHAAERFYQGTTTLQGASTKPLNQIVDPEHKRRIIGDTFMHVAHEALTSLQLDPEQVYLAQGTLRPDLIESASPLASAKAAVIKTHHNDTALVRALRAKGRIIEPLQDYHKDEVRLLGKELGLPDAIVQRQPFPGPGLAIRILCAEHPYLTADFTTLNQQLASLTPFDISATLLPVQTVGVQGDGRSYSYLAGLSGARDWTKLFFLARTIPKRLHHINRVVYIFGDPVPGPIREITPTHLTPEVIHQLQHADALVHEELARANLLTTLSQVPVISFPVHFGREGTRSLGIRTFITNDFMVGRPALPGKDIPEEVLESIVQRLLHEVPGISRVCYDLTSKPPGTTEWE